ncbi:hypothetical protein ACP275_02G032300 [Erythranthe tilingii]
MSSRGGRFYWVRNREEGFKPKGVIVVFSWISISDFQLKDFARLYSSLGWNSLVCRSDYLNPFIPERATSLAFSVVVELVKHPDYDTTEVFRWSQWKLITIYHVYKELRNGPCPVVLASFSGGSKACMYKVLQIIEGCSDVDLSLEDSRLVVSCISGQIYDSDPIEFTSDLGARFALHRSILKMPGSSKLVSLFAKGVTSSLDALFITSFGSQRADYWETLYSSVGLEAPFLIVFSENDDVAPFSTLCNFAQQLQVLGGNVKVVKLSTSAHVGHYKHQNVQYTAAINELLEKAISNFSEKIQKLSEKSNQSFRRISFGQDDDHFFLPSSSDYRNSRDFEPTQLQQDPKERLPHRSSPCLSANSVLGQALFDVCIPKNIEGWDIKFSGSLNGEPFGSIRRRSTFSGMKQRSRL